MQQLNTFLKQFTRFPQGTPLSSLCSRDICLLWSLLSICTCRCSRPSLSWLLREWSLFHSCFLCWPCLSSSLRCLLTARLTSKCFLHYWAASPFEVVSKPARPVWHTDAARSFLWTDEAPSIYKRYAVSSLRSRTEPRSYSEGRLGSSPACA